jgi:phosphoribosylformylglycinamidine synthase
MTYHVDVNVMPLKDLLDPQGKAVLGGLASLSLTSVTDVRIGKRIRLTVEAATPEEARAVAEEASKRLLANPVMETFEVTVAG